MKMADYGFVMIRGKLFSILCVFLLLLTGCKSPPPVQLPPPDENVLKEFMDTTSRDGKLVFLGAAGIRSRRQDSINLALEEAARRISIFQELKGGFSTLSRRGGRLLDYRAETSVTLFYSRDYEKYLSDIEFDENTDVLESENAVFVRVRYPGGLGVDYALPPPLPGGEPSWVDNPPTMIGDYHAGVGYAGRRNAHKDTVKASYENAIFSIIRDVGAVAWDESYDYTGEGFLDIASIVTMGINARATLNWFYVLDTWTDPSDKSVWTLAIAKKKIP